MHPLRRTKLIDDLRKEATARREPLVDQLDGHPAGRGPDVVLGPSPEIAAALGGPKRDQARQVIALRIGGDLTTGDIAALVGTSVDNIHQILSRALRHMRDRLDPVVHARASCG